MIACRGDVSLQQPRDDEGTDMKNREVEWTDGRYNIWRDADGYWGVDVVSVNGKTQTLYRAPTSSRGDSVAARRSGARCGPGNSHPRNRLPAVPAGSKTSLKPLFGSRQSPASTESKHDDCAPRSPRLAPRGA